MMVCGMSIPILGRFVSQNRLLQFLLTRYPQLTLLQTMVESSEGNDYWTPEILTQSLMGIWLAASFQPWVVSFPFKRPTYCC